MFDNVYISWNVSYELPLRENIKLAEMGTAQENPNSIWTVTDNTGMQRALNNRLANQEQKRSKEQMKIGIMPCSLSDLSSKEALQISLEQC